MNSLHHLRRRQRARAALAPFDYLMYGVSFVYPLALLPQVLAVYVDGKTQGVSTATWLMLTFINGLWAVYGIRHRDKPILIANALLAVFDIAIVAGVLFS